MGGGGLGGGRGVGVWGHLHAKIYPGYDFLVYNHAKTSKRICFFSFNSEHFKVSNYLLFFISVL